MMLLSVLRIDNYVNVLCRLSAYSSARRVSVVFCKFELGKLERRLDLKIGVIDE